MGRSPVIPNVKAEAMLLPTLFRESRPPGAWTRLASQSHTLTAIIDNIGYHCELHLLCLPPFDRKGLRKGLVAFLQPWQGLHPIDYKCCA
jgi:hypothetical protein